MATIVSLHSDERALGIRAKCGWLEVWEVLPVRHYASGLGPTVCKGTVGGSRIVAEGCMCGPHRLGPSGVDWSCGRGFTYTVVDRAGRQGHVPNASGTAKVIAGKRVSYVEAR